MDNGLQRQPSLRDKFISSICCFTGSVHDHHHDDAFENSEIFYNKLPHPLRTPTTPNSNYWPGGFGSWLKKSPTSECKGRGGIMSRMSRRHQRQSQSADFSYDPSSYALNFEDDSRAYDDVFPLRHFSSRAPVSPPTPMSPSSLPTPSSGNLSEELPVSVSVPAGIVAFR